MELLAGVEEEVKKLPGLYLGGNYRTGVAFGDCVQYGVDVANEVCGFLKSDTSPAESAPVVKAPVNAESMEVAV